MEETDLAINHIRNHHDLVVRCIRELERCFRSLDVKDKDDWIVTLDAVLNTLEADLAVVCSDGVPQSDSNLCPHGSI